MKESALITERGAKTASYGNNIARNRDEIRWLHPGANYPCV